MAAYLAASGGLLQSHLIVVEMTLSKCSTEAFEAYRSTSVMSELTRPSAQTPPACCIPHPACPALRRPPPVLDRLICPTPSRLIGRVFAFPIDLVILMVLTPIDSRG